MIIHNSNVTLKYIILEEEINKPEVLQATNSNGSLKSKETLLNSNFER